MDVAIGEQTYVEGYGTLNVYNDEVTGRQSNDENYVVPQENADTNGWSGATSGSAYIFTTGSATGAKPGARPPIRLISTRQPGAYPGGDYQQVMSGYAQAYRDETGREPGVLSFFAMVLITIAIFVFAIAAIAIASMLIKASTVNSVDQYTTEEGETVFRSCIGNLIGGVSCYWYNASTGETSAAEGTEGLGSTIETVVKYVAIGAAVIGTVYVLAKVVPGLFARSSSGASEATKLAVK
jgi:hypothetical protein